MSRKLASKQVAAPEMRCRQQYAKWGQEGVCMRMRMCVAGLLHGYCIHMASDRLSLLRVSSCAQVALDFGVTRNMPMCCSWTIRAVLLCAVLRCVLQAA